MNSFDAERSLRFSQLKSSGGDSLKDFKRALNIKPNLSIELEKYLNFAISIKYDHKGLDSLTYLAHPLRVATIAIKESKDISVNLIATSLLHNIKEVSRPSFELLKSFCDPSITKALNLLTVNRSNSSKTYKEKYYKSIYNADSFVGEVKAFDKLDNLFMLCLNSNLSIRQKYLEEIEIYVFPLVKKYLPHLELYFANLVKDCRDLGFVNLD